MTQQHPNEKVVTSRIINWIKRGNIVGTGRDLFKIFCCFLHLNWMDEMREKVYNVGIGS